MPATRRQQLIAELTRAPATVRQLAALFGLPIKQVVEDLQHVSRSLGKSLVACPAKCQACGLVLSKRDKLTAPSRCPRCKSERTSEPLLRIGG